MTVACGPEGLDGALRRGDIAVIVDVLRFSSAATTAVANGFTVLPRSRPYEGEPTQGGVRTTGRTAIPRYSLSPLDYLDPKDPGNVVLVSPNGAFLAEKVGEKDTAFLGCFLNGRALARIVSALAVREGRGITLVAAGEIEEDRTDGVRIPRFAVEDWLGCGHILYESRMALSVEADVCRRAYEACRADLKDVILGSLSGRYLEGRGKACDVSHCVQRDIYDVAPAVRCGAIVKYEQEMYG